MIKKELNSFIDAFLEYRKTNISKLVPYNEVLFKEFLSDKSSKTTLNNKKETTTDRHDKKIIHSIGSYILSGLKANSRISLLKEMLNKETSLLVLGISSDRLIKSETNKSTREYLAQMSIGFKETKTPYLLHDKIIESRNIVIFDVNSKSRIQNYKELYHNEGILLIDQDFIRSLAISYPFKCSKYITRYIYHRLKNKKENTRETLIPIVLLYNEIFDVLFKGFSKIDSYFYTSNTFSIEVLRYYFMLQKSSKSINEIMHGIPSEIVQSFFLKLICINDSINKGSKLNFIVQIPNIKDVVLNERLDCVSENIFINSQINAYFLDKKVEYKNVYNYFESRFKNIYFNDYNNEFLFLFVGGRLIFPEYEKSISFKVELEMIEMVRQFFKSKKRTYKILYAPHPFNNIKNLLNQKIFQEDDITFIKDTLEALLMAQATTGIISSVLFEAKMFNIPSFIPMKYSDKMFTKEELNLLTYPNQNEDRKESFKKFLYTIDLTKQTNIKDQIKNRINIVNTVKNE